MQFISPRACATALVACGLAGAFSAAPASATSIAGGNTTLVLDSRLSSALRQAGVTVGADAPSGILGRRVRLSVNDGDLQMATARGSLTHSGTLFFLTPKRRALLRRITMSSGAITANIGENEGLPLARLERRSAKTRRSAGSGSVKASGIVATFTSEGAGELNRVLGVGVFRAGQRLGLVSIDAERALRVTGGSATLTVDPAFNASLATSKFVLAAAPPASGDNLTSFVFPVASGEVGAESLDGQLKLSGGVTVDNEGPFITLRDPIVNTAGTRSALTIIAGPFGRVPVADIDLTRAKIVRDLDAKGGTITLTGVPVRFSPLAATALTLVGIPTLKGQLLGRANATLRIG